VSADGRGLVSQAGAVLLWETLRVTGLGRGLSQGLSRWRAPRAVHDPGKVVADLAAAVALGGDCLADIAVLREQPELAGPVASDPVVSWLVTVDLDATIVIAHSEKDQARPTWKKTFGFHPMTAWPITARAGTASPSPYAAAGERRQQHGRRPCRGHPPVPGAAARQLRRRVLVRADSAGGTHDFLDWLTARSRRLHYSVGMTITEDMQAAILQVPAGGWTPACDGDGQVRDGAWVADITGLLDLSSWPGPR
jgi:hypothetical protein